ncbi:MAG: PilC/PilY family type IV pilus protein, partial [Pseudomonadales bacterium]
MFAGLTALTLALVNIPPAVAAELQLTDAPLFIALGVAPNVILTLDDSSSMTNCRITDDGTDRDWLIDKDGDFGPLDTAYLAATSPELNKLAYDPNIKYVIPENPITGLPVNVPSFTAALVDGYDSGSATINLSTSWRPCRSKTSWWDPYSQPGDGPGKPAYYTIFTGSDPKNESQVANNANYTVITVGIGEQQNFANWFSFYRWRYLAIKTVAARAFAHPDLDNRIRLAQSLMWGGEDRYCTSAGWPGACGDQPYQKARGGPITMMKHFSGANRDAFFTWLYATDTSGGTPLLMSMNRAGKYYMDKYPVYDTLVPYEYYRWEDMNAIDSPWAFEPGVKRDPAFSCRQAYHVLMTDGGWSSSSANVGIQGNIDNQSHTYPEALPSGATSYTPFAPYKDSNVLSAGGYNWGFVADNAFYYWVNDLQPTLANDVPAYMADLTPHPVTGLVEDNPNNDPATWQHMVTFTVGFAVDGDIPQTPANYQSLLNGGLSWSSNKIDDLWHGAINGRGKFMNAKSSQQLVDAFAAAMTEVIARTSSGASVASNSGSLEAGSRLFQGRFNSGTWTGQVLAFDLNVSTGAAASTESWDAAPLLTARVQGGGGSGWDTDREVITFDGTNGIPFRWSSLSAGMQADLDTDSKGVNDGQGLERLQYLRGSEADEGTNGNQYRARASKLGDIINSAPVYVGDPSFTYPDNLEASKYSAFKASNTGRTPMVYVGANDGMLHGLDANSGEEKIAYVPNKVFANLTRLTATAYAHRFFVDGAPTVGDVFYSGAWHTVLAGGLRKGGQGIYALDVTDPASLSEIDASSLVLWEFTDADDADLGYTYSRPAIVRMANGTWAAVFGNGHNNTEADGNASSTGDAVLYIVDISNGNLIKKIDTKAGSATTPNGLAGVAPVDVDGDRTIDYIYAGDLLGNLWKFDVSSSNSAQWKVAYKSGSTPLPLYVAKDKFGVPQPITAQPEVGAHPKNSTSGVLGNGGYMVYFGTGKYIESG